MKRGIVIGLVITLILSAIWAVLPLPVCAMTGSGTVGDPYIIYDVDDLQDMENDLTAYYELANDIDASATSGWNGGAGFVPVGDAVTPFEGYFDGNGYTISDLYIYRSTTQDIGLFGKIYAEGIDSVFQNVTMEKAIIEGKLHVGAFAGDIVAYPVFPVGTVTLQYINGVNCEVTSNGYDVGGLVGQMLNIVELDYCSYTGIVDGVGGATGAAAVGGLVGYASADTTIYRCATGVEVTQSNWGSIVGGLVGHTQGHIEECFSVGSVSNIGADPDSAYEGIGGLVGKYDPVVQDPSDILNCYSRCSVTGKVGTYGEKVAGLVGIHVGTYSDIINSYSTGLVSGGLTRGGLTTHSSSDCYDCFWDMQTSEQSSSACGTGKNTTPMKTESTFTDAGWNFTTIWGMGGVVNDGYPYLLWWYAPFEWEDYDIYQVLWFQPNAIIEGTTLPNRTGEVDGIITWGANPAGITITHGELIPEEEYDFEPIIPVNPDIIKPEPEVMTGNIDLESLRDHPLHPFVQILSIDGFLNERLVWIGLAWLSVIIAMFLVHIGLDTHRNSKKPQHFILTVITGLGLSILWYSATVFPLWVIIVMAFGLVPAIIWERQPVI